MSDMEIYVDNLAAMQIHNMNKYIEFTRAKLQEKGTSTTDHYMKPLKQPPSRKMTILQIFSVAISPGLQRILKKLIKRIPIPEMTQQKLMRLKRPLNRFRKQIMLHRLK